MNTPPTTPPVTPQRPRPVHKRTISGPSPPDRPISPDLFGGRVKALPSPPLEPVVRNEIEWAENQRRLSEFPVPTEAARQSYIHEIGVRQTVDHYLDDGRTAPTVFNWGDELRWGDGLGYGPVPVSSVPMTREPSPALRPPFIARPFSVLSPAIQATSGPLDPGHRPILARRFVSFDDVPEWRLRRALEAKPPFWRRWLNKLKSFFSRKPAEGADVPAK